MDTLLQRIVASAPSAPTIQLPGTPVPVAAALGSGVVALAGYTAEYRIRLVDASGTVIRQLCRETEPLPLSPHEIAFADNQKAFESVAHRARIGRLFAGADGRLWVQRNRILGANGLERAFGPVGAVFDVFEPDGQYLGEVRAPAEARIAAAHGDLVIGLRVGGLGEVSVVGYRITQ